MNYNKAPRHAVSLTEVETYVYPLQLFKMSLLLLFNILQKTFKNVKEQSFLNVRIDLRVIAVSPSICLRRTKNFQFGSFALNQVRRRCQFKSINSLFSQELNWIPEISQRPDDATLCWTVEILRCFSDVRAYLSFELSPVVHTISCFPGFTWELIYTSASRCVAVGPRFPSGIH